MTKDAELGRAVVPIRAELGDLDKDLNQAQSRIEKVLGGVAKGAGIALGGIVGVGGAAVGVFSKLAADAAPLEGIQASFAGITGDAEGMLGALREGSLSMATDADLMRTYNEAAQLVGKGFADELPNAMQYLSKVSAATGQDMGFMLESLVKGVGRLSGPILDNLGIQVEMAEATERAAEMFGVEADALTKAQQQAGMMAVVTEKLAANTADMPDVSENAATQMAQLGASMQNVKDQIGMALLPVLTAVMGPLGELAEKYGPQIGEVFGRLAELVGPLLGSAFETLIPAVMGLLDTLIPLAETILEQLFPAFAAIMEAIVPLVAVLLEELVPVFTAVLGAVLPVIVALVEMLAPILAQIISSLLPVLVPLIKLVAETFGRLLLVLMPLIGALLSELVPVFLTILELILPPLTEILAVLIDVVLDLVEAALPAWIAQLNILLPIIGGLVEVIAAGVSVALEYLAAIIRTLVQPALDWLITSVLDPIIDVFERMKIGIQAVTEFFGDLVRKLKEIDLPPWLVPGSPTPLEIGLKGIAWQLRQVDRAMSGWNTTLAMESVGAGAGRASSWYGDIYIQGSTDPQATAEAVLRALQDRGIWSGSALR